MKKIIPFSLILLRKLVTSLITAIFCMAALFIFETTTGLKSSSLFQHYLIVMLVVLWIYLMVLGTIISLISDFATRKLSAPWRPIVAAVIHIGAIVIYLLVRANADFQIYTMYISIASLYWVIDELLRLLHKFVGKKIRSQKANLETE